jgi:hypothetical protein
VSTPTLTTDLLNRLDADRVGAYLAARGWEQVEVRLWAQDGASVLLPDRQAGEPAGGWQVLVETLAHVEGRAAGEVYADLIVAPVDRQAAAHPVCLATARACEAALAQLHRLAVELRVAGGAGHAPTGDDTAKLRRAAEAAVAAVVAAATATAEVVRLGDTSIVASATVPAANQDPQER